VRIKVIDEEHKKLTGKYMEVNFHRLDGAYSYCTDDEGNPVHLAVWTPVEIVK
jgi:hypothetical protein